ncbi:MAG: Mov34/MPN/PAD-1 family protein [Methanobrevibacter sp.]|jgi:proteasome lid subunit RPN8/RPN11|nr:Mov34/MPN/PAD-1 family protein [Candidatus Methanoflexus mossambicus]
MLDKLFSKIVKNDKMDFNEVHVKEEVIDYICELAINADPNEFMSNFEGKVKNKILTITGLVFLPTISSGEAVVMQTNMMPVTMTSWGTVHSHPGPSALPSDADLFTFSKNGLFHMIISRPYRVEDIIAYNRYGEFMDYQII